MPKHATRVCVQSGRRCRMLSHACSDDACSQVSHSADLHESESTRTPRDQTGIRNHTSHLVAWKICALVHAELASWRSCLPFPNLTIWIL